MNEIANVCELVGADVDQVRKAIGADRRIGTSFLFPGVGYGGSCFPKDMQALLKSAADKGYDFKILRAVEDVNDRQKGRLVEKIAAQFKRPDGQNDRAVGPGVQAANRRHARGAGDSDYRGLAGARREGASLRSGRRAGRQANLRRAGSSCASKSYDALAGADALAIVTEWNEFREPDFERMRSLLKAPVVFDGRNIYSPEQMRALGFTYFSIGR